MPADTFGPGETCNCQVTICNPTDNTYYSVPVFVILDVYGMLFFAPEFNEFSYYLYDITPGITMIQVLPDFAWPPGAGTATGIIWYAAMTDPEFTGLFGELDAFTFGWHD